MFRHQGARIATWRSTTTCFAVLRNACVGCFDHGAAMACCHVAVERHKSTTAASHSGFQYCLGLSFNAFFSAAKHLQIVSGKTPVQAQHRKLQHSNTCVKHISNREIFGDVPFGPFGLEAEHSELQHDNQCMQRRAVEHCVECTQCVGSSVFGMYSNNPWLCDCYMFVKQVGAFPTCFPLALTLECRETHRDFLWRSIGCLRES